MEPSQTSPGRPWLTKATKSLRSLAWSHRVILGLSLVLTGLCLWAYWPTFGAMAHKWVTTSEYSHGYIVPAFALFLLWWRRSLLTKATFQFNWWGVPLLAVGGAMRVASAYLYFDWLDAISLLPCLAGLFVLLGGWPGLKWSWPAVAFLIFMIPLPHRIETGLAHPLQRVATMASNYALQTIGLPAFAEGNTIYLNKHVIGVVEACSGLSMLLVFFAISTGMAILIKRPWLDKALIFVSAIPVALVANITRITVTGLLIEWVGGEVADVFFHDLAGWLMMPFAILLLWGELALISLLLVEPPADAPAPLAFASPSAQNPAPVRKGKSKARTRN